jgi:hypothetical protein
LKELVRVTRDHLGQLRVAGSNLLQDGLEHLRLLLYHLSQLLKLWVVTQKVQTIAAECAASSSSSTGGR